RKAQNQSAVCLQNLAHVSVEVHHRWRLHLEGYAVNRLAHPEERSTIHPHWLCCQIDRPPRPNSVERRINRQAYLGKPNGCPDRVAHSLAMCAMES
ncbi:hypothetical protein H4R35_007592, partial [Dimargaris xerosporica]